LNGEKTTSFEKTAFGRSNRNEEGQKAGGWGKKKQTRSANRGGRHQKKIAEYQKQRPARGVRIREKKEKRYQKNGIRSKERRGGGGGNVKGARPVEGRGVFGQKKKKKKRRRVGERGQNFPGKEPIGKCRKSNEQGVFFGEKDIPALKKGKRGVVQIGKHV